MSYPKMKLVEFGNKYGEQIVALECETTGNVTLFDACTLFMREDTVAENEKIRPQAVEFAKRFVEQFNRVDAALAKAEGKE